MTKFFITQKDPSGFIEHKLPSVNYQVQCQMAVTEIHKIHLVIYKYTTKGIAFIISSVPSIVKFLLGDETSHSDNFNSKISDFFFLHNKL